MALVSLEFVYDTAGSSFIIRLDTARDEYSSVGGVKAFLSEKFGVPVETIHIFDNRHYVDSRNEGFPDLPDNYPTRASEHLWWTHIAEEPQNWKRKRDRCLNFVDCAIEQVTFDMNVSLFGLYKFSYFKNMTVGEWEKLNELNENYVPIVSYGSTTPKEDYDNHRSQVAFKSALDDLYQKYYLITKDISSVMKNIQDLVNVNDVQLGQVSNNINSSRTRHGVEEVEGFVLPVREKSLEGYRRHWRVHPSDMDVSDPDEVTTTSRSLEYSFQSNNYDVQKSAGYLLALKREKCLIESHIHQLETRRKLYILRDYLLDIRTKSDVLVDDTLIDKEGDWIKNTRRLKRKINVLQGCLPSCCVGTLPPFPLIDPVSTLPRTPDSSILELIAEVHHPNLVWITPHVHAVQVPDKTFFSSVHGSFVVTKEPEFALYVTDSAKKWMKLFAQVQQFSDLTFKISAPKLEENSASFELNFDRPVHKLGLSVFGGTVTINEDKNKDVLRLVNESMKNYFAHDFHVTCRDEKVKISIVSRPIGDEIHIKDLKTTESQKVEWDWKGTLFEHLNNVDIKWGKDRSKHRDNFCPHKLDK